MSTADPTSEQRWEYCYLYFVGATIYDTSQRGTGARTPPVPIETHYHVHVAYMGPDGAEMERQLVKFEDQLPYNPFYKVIGLLGGAGWELVSVEVGGGVAWTDEVGREVVPYSAGLHPMSRSAYFKRPVVAGRGVDEPALTL